MRKTLVERSSLAIYSRKQILSDSHAGGLKIRSCWVLVSEANEGREVAARPQGATVFPWSKGSRWDRRLP